MSFSGLIGIQFMQDRVGTASPQSRLPHKYFYDNSITDDKGSLISLSGAGATARAASALVYDGLAWALQSGATTDLSYLGTLHIVLRKEE